MDTAGFDAVNNLSEASVLFHGGDDITVAADFSSKNLGIRKEFSSKPPKFPGTSKSNPSPSSSPQGSPGSPHSSPLNRQPSSSGPAFTKSKSRFAEPPPPTSPSQAVLDINRHPESDISSSISSSGDSLNPLIPKGPQQGAGDEEEGLAKQTVSQGRRSGRVWAWIDRIWGCSTACGCINPSGKCGVIWACLEWFILISAMVCLAMSLTIRRLRGFVLWDMEIWKWCLLVSGICCGRLVSNWYTESLVFLVKRNILLKKKKHIRKNLIYYIYELKKNVQVCVWIILVIYPLSVAFDSKIHRSPKTARVLRYVHRALASLLVGSMIWLLKSLVVQMLASSFHMKRFFDRIQESLYHQYLLTLLGPRVMESGKEQVNRKGEEESGEIDMEKLYRMSHEEVHAWMMKTLIDKVKMGLTTEHSVDNRSSEQGEQEIGSRWTATFVASQIFKNVAGHDSKYIEEQHLLKFFTEKVDVDNVLRMLTDAGKSEKIEESTLTNWLVKAYFDRMSLKHALNDAKTAVDQMHAFVDGVVAFVIIIITLLIMGFLTIQILAYLCSPFILLAVVFGNACKTAFDAIIFLFVMHPFDVGDHCIIDDKEMVVEEMYILTTVFMGDGNQKIYYPNSVLATEPITNFHRSPDMGDSKLSMGDKTSAKCIGDLKDEVNVGANRRHRSTLAPPNSIDIVPNLITSTNRSTTSVGFSQKASMLGGETTHYINRTQLRLSDNVGPMCMARPHTTT